MRALARGAHTAKSNRLDRLPTLRVWLRHAVATARSLRIARDYGGLHPIPPPFPIREGGEGSHPLRRGTGRRGRPGHTSEARPRPKEPPSTQENTPPEGTGKFPLDKLSAVVVQLSARGRIGSGVIRSPPASARESKSGKSPEGYISLPGFYSTRGSTQYWDSLHLPPTWYTQPITAARHMSTNVRAILRATPCDADFFFASGGVAGAAARRRGSRGGRTAQSGTGGHRGCRASGRRPRLIVGPYTSRPAAQQPSRKSSPQTCCYGSSLSARARYPHIDAAARPRTPSGSYAARRSAAAETPLPPASHPAIRPDVSGASGNPSPEKPTQTHRIPNASPKPICPSDSPGGASLSSSRQSRTAARSATGAAPKRR